MRNRSPISIFPFLSVLLSTMGVLSFLAVTFMMFSSNESAREEVREPVQVQWVGAPAHVRPILVECREELLVIHRRAGGVERTYSRSALEQEVRVVKELLRIAYGEIGRTASDTQRWLYLKRAVQRDRRLSGSFTRRMHDVEIDNISGRNRREEVERYPILLVYPDGFEIYELASFLVETTTRLALGLEPMLKGWSLPYGELSL